MQTNLIYPMYAMVILTVIVALLTVRSRFAAVRNKEMDARYFKTYSVGTPTEAVLKTGRHFSNLFELPVLFYAGCLAAMSLTPNNTTLQIYAWLFVLSRIVHAWIHIGVNRIYPRMLAFAFGLMVLLAMWTHLILIVRVP